MQSFKKKKVGFNSSTLRFKKNMSMDMKDEENEEIN